MNFIEKLEELDKNLFLAINGMHNPFLDEIMYWASHRFFWIPLYAVLLFLIVKSGKRTVVVVLFVALLITVADQGSVHLFKNTFQRYRPCYNEEIKNLIHLVGNCGGKFGFISSHAANVFALAMFLTLLLGRQIKYIYIVLFFWASLVSYSRIYVGRHYPSDVVAGGVYGMIIAFLLYKLFLYVNKRLDDRIAFRGKLN